MTLKITYSLGFNVNIKQLTLIASLETGKVKNKNLIKLKATSNCWICEGWTEFKFTFNVPEHLEIDNDMTPIMLHASCDKY